MKNKLYILLTSILFLAFPIVAKAEIEELLIYDTNFESTSYQKNEEISLAVLFNGNSNILNFELDYNQNVFEIIEYGIDDKWTGNFENNKLDVKRTEIEQSVVLAFRLRVKEVLSLSSSIKLRKIIYENKNSDIIPEAHISLTKNSNKLSALKVDEYDLYPNFSSDIYEYTIYVPKSILFINISSILDGNTSEYVEGYEGNRYVDLMSTDIAVIKIRDLDGNETEYKINVKDESEKPSESKSEFSKNTKKIILVVCVGVLTIALVVLLFIRISRKTNKK